MDQEPIVFRLNLIIALLIAIIGLLFVAIVPAQLFLIGGILLFPVLVLAVVLLAARL